MLIGYMRVSKTDGSQALDLQRDALLAAGVAPARLYQDHASGKQDDRPGLEACLKSLRPGDTLVAWKLDRLGRDLRHLVTLAHELSPRRAAWYPKPAATFADALARVRQHLWFEHLVISAGKADMTEPIPHEVRRLIEAACYAP